MSEKKYRRVGNVDAQGKTDLKIYSQEEVNLIMVMMDDWGYPTHPNAVFKEVIERDPYPEPSE